MCTDTIENHIEAYSAFGTVICGKIGENIAKLGLPISPPLFDAAEFSLVTDPFTQSRDLVATWKDARKQRIGELKFYSDGSFYAEYSVMQLHPLKKHVLVDAVSAWGKQDNIKLETRLLDIPH